jgi:nucleotide-binding universal stress UspA family protein
MVCDKSLLLAFVMETKQITLPIVDRSIKELEEKSVPAEIYVLTGVPFQEIVQFAEKEKADLIIIGSHGRSKLKHFLLGSVAEKVAKKSSIPVLIYKPAK